MPVTILDGPNNQRCCFFCSPNKNSQPMSMAIYKEIEDIEYEVEILLRYCPRCGREIMPEREYREAWVKIKDRDSRLFTIDSEIATFNLIKAMNEAEKNFGRNINNERNAL